MFGVITAKVHLTPTLFLAKNESTCYLKYFCAAIFGFGQIIDFLCPDEIPKIAPEHHHYCFTTEFEENGSIGLLWH